MFNMQRCRLYSIVGPKVERNGDRGRPRLDILEEVLVSERNAGSGYDFLTHVVCAKSYAQ